MIANCFPYTGCKKLSEIDKTKTNDKKKNLKLFQGRVEDNTNSFKSEDSIPENNLEQKTKNDSPDMFAVVEVATGDKHGDLVTQAKFEQSAKSDGLEKGEIVTDLELYEGKIILNFP